MTITQADANEDGYGVDWGRIDLFLDWLTDRTDSLG
jgi:hypothetical protein